MQSVRELAGKGGRWSLDTDQVAAIWRAMFDALTPPAASQDSGAEDIFGPCPPSLKGEIAAEIAGHDLVRKSARTEDEISDFHGFVQEQLDRLVPDVGVATGDAEQADGSAVATLATGPSVAPSPETTDVRERAQPTCFYDSKQRPVGNNADEWHLFLNEWLSAVGNRVEGLPFMAVQIAEAIDAAERRGCVFADAHAKLTARPDVMERALAIFDAAFDPVYQNAAKDEDAMNLGFRAGLKALADANLLRTPDIAATGGASADCADNASPCPALVDLYDRLAFAEATLAAERERAEKAEREWKTQVTRRTDDLAILGEWKARAEKAERRVADFEEWIGPAEEKWAAAQSQVTRLTEDLAARTGERDTAEKLKRQYWSNYEAATARPYALSTSRATRCCCNRCAGEIRA